MKDIDCPDEKLKNLTQILLIIIFMINEMTL